MIPKKDILSLASNTLKLGCNSLLFSQRNNLRQNKLLTNVKTLHCDLRCIFCAFFGFSQSGSSFFGLRPIRIEQQPIGNKWTADNLMQLASQSFGEKCNQPMNIISRGWIYPFRVFLVIIFVLGIWKKCIRFWTRRNKHIAVFDSLEWVQCLQSDVFQLTQTNLVFSGRTVSCNSKWDI